MSFPRSRRERELVSKWTLTSYLDDLRRRCPSEVIDINEPIEPDYLLMAVVLELERRREYPVIVAHRMLGYDMPVVMNVMASKERLAEMAGTTVEGMPAKWLEAESSRMKPRLVAGGPVKDVVLVGEQVDAQKFPVMKHFEADAGRYITSAIVVARDPDTGVCNLSYHRMQLKGPRKFGISLHSRQHLWDYLERAEARGQDLEAAAVIGAHPLVLLGASSKTSIEVDEYDIISSLMGEPLDLVRCETIDVPVPAQAEIVIEGKILAGVREPEGPFGEYTGYSTSRSTQNVFVASGLLHRERPIYMAIAPGYSSEHLNLMRVAKESLMLERLRERVPTLSRIYYPKSGANFHCYLSLKKSADGVARQALMLLFGLDPYVKLAVAVDDDIDITNEEEILWAMATRFQADRDAFVVPKVFCNRLDPSSVEGMSAKMGIDATVPSGWDVIKSSVPTEWQHRARQILDRNKTLVKG
jgi:UbiD family decarboxylase